MSPAFPIVVTVLAVPMCLLLSWLVIKLPEWRFRRQQRRVARDRVKAIEDWRMGK